MALLETATGFWGRRLGKASVLLLLFPPPGGGRSWVPCGSAAGGEGSEPAWMDGREDGLRAVAGGECRRQRGSALCLVPPSKTLPLAFVHTLVFVCIAPT